jgi:hypothetical protein
VETCSAGSQNALDIGFGEIIADVQQAAGMFLRHVIGEAIAEIEGGRVPALPPLLLSPGDTPRRGLVDRYDFKTEPADQG